MKVLKALEKERCLATDRIIPGRTNYNKTVSAYKENKRFYNECAKEVITFCKKRGISYHIKAKMMMDE